MRVLMSLGLTLVAARALAAPAAIDRGLTLNELSTLAQQIAIAQQQLDAAPNARVQFAAALQQLAAAQTQLGELLRQVSAAPPAQAAVQQLPPDNPPVYLSPIGDATLRALVQQIGAVPFSGDKVNVLRQAASGNYFLVDQAARLLPLFVHSSDKIAALQLLAPQLLDRQNGFKLIGAFAFSSDRDKARQILDAAPPLQGR